MIKFIKSLLSRRPALCEYKFTDSTRYIRKLMDWEKRTKAHMQLNPAIGYSSSARVIQAMQDFAYEREKGDYWKSFAEFQTDKSGDCEDFALYYIWLRNRGRLVVGTLPNGENHAIAWDLSARKVFDVRKKELVADSHYCDLIPIYCIDIEFDRRSPDKCNIVIKIKEKI